MNLNYNKIHVECSSTEEMMTRADHKTHFSGIAMRFLIKEYTEENISLFWLGFFITSNYHFDCHYVIL